MPISFFIHDGQGGIKLCILKKLPGRPRHHETMMRVIRWRFVPLMDPFAVGIKVIIPNQSVGIRKRIRLKIKWSCANEFLARTPAKRYQERPAKNRQKRPK